MKGASKDCRSRASRSHRSPSLAPMDCPEAIEGDVPVGCPSPTVVTEFAPTRPRIHSRPTSRPGGQPASRRTLDCSPTSRFPRPILQVPRRHRRSRKVGPSDPALTDHLPSDEDPVVASSVGWLGGRVGRRARIGGTWWKPVRSARRAGRDRLHHRLPGRPALSQQRLGDPDRYEPVLHRHLPAVLIRGFADGIMPYLNPNPTGQSLQYLEYPVLTGAFMQVASMITRHRGRCRRRGQGRRLLRRQRGAAFVALAVTVVATALTVRRRPWDAAMVALAPTVILGATSTGTCFRSRSSAVALLCGRATIRSRPGSCSAWRLPRSSIRCSSLARSSS